MAASLLSALGAVSAKVLPALVSALQQAPQRAPIPAQPPLKGPGWTVWVPALLFLVAAAGTWSLWRHFADKDD